MRRKHNENYFFEKTGGVKGMNKSIQNIYNAIKDVPLFSDDGSDEDVRAEEIHNETGESGIEQGANEQLQRESNSE